MRQLNQKEIELVSGAFLPLLAAVVAVIAAPKLINDHRKEYNQWGHNLAEVTFDYLHPYDPNNPSGIYR